ncbi:hypothetical protein L1887_11662 [Cichorium endivia]|nr:hypothetical protein L1887_11662 [Cichorium endivia]
MVIHTIFSTTSKCIPIIRVVPSGNNIVSILTSGPKAFLMALNIPIGIAQDAVTIRRWWSWSLWVTIDVERGEEPEPWRVPTADLGSVPAAVSFPSFPLPLCRFPAVELQPEEIGDGKPTSMPMFRISPLILEILSLITVADSQFHESESPPRAQAKSPPTKMNKEEDEDVCFICFDGALSAGPIGIIGASNEDSNIIFMNESTKDDEDPCRLNSECLRWSFLVSSTNLLYSI